MLSQSNPDPRHLHTVLQIALETRDTAQASLSALEKQGDQLERVNADLDVASMLLDTVLELLPPHSNVQLDTEATIQRRHVYQRIRNKKKRSHRQKSGCIILPGHIHLSASNELTVCHLLFTV
jgi:hypothetical protein